MSQGGNIRKTATYTRYVIQYRLHPVTAIVEELEKEFKESIQKKMAKMTEMTKRTIWC